MAPAASPSSATTRVALLAAQGLALGLTLAWTTIPGSTVFLSVYGADLLPVTYIGAAVAGVLSSAMLSIALRRQPVAGVATKVLGGLTAALVVSWLLLGRPGTAWVSFALLVFVPIVVPVGFIFVVGQAGQLLDVRALKALYGRVVAGFALGVVVGGLTGPVLLDVLGGTEDLLLTAAMASAMWLALVGAARRRYPNELAVIEHEEEPSERASFSTVARNRYVRLLVAFQMLSAVESQWLDFLVFDRAAGRYRDTDELARFVSRFAALAYGADILFLLIVAGLLLRRFGLRYGLTANSLGVLTVVAAIIVATTAQGTGATIVFVLVVAARAADLTLSDGASRTSLSAAYQAVPNRLRAVAQATVEGLAVPVAIGISGVVLLALDLAGSTGGLLLPSLTAVVLVGWFVVGIALWRDYGANLLASLRGRTLDPTELTVDDESSRVVVDRLLESTDERDVRLGLDILTVAEHPALHARLEQLAADARVGVRRDALERLRLLAPHLAADAARAAMDDPAPEVRAAGIRVLGAAGVPSDVADVLAHLEDRSHDVRVAVAFAWSRMDPAGASGVGNEIDRLARSDAADDRALAAGMLGECDPDGPVDRTILRTLLRDLDPAVAVAALAATHWPHDADLLPEASRHVSHRATSEAAGAALVRAGDAALPVVDDGLRSGDVEQWVLELYVRVARDIGSPPAMDVLRSHIEHPDRQVGLSVMRALGSVVSTLDAQGGAADPRELAVVSSDVEQAAHVLRALVALEGEAEASLLRGALVDELDLLCRRVVAALSMRHGTDGMQQVTYQLVQRDGRSHALAIEWLDLHLEGPERAVVALLEPNLSWRDRLRRLAPTTRVEPTGVRGALLEIVRGDPDRWRPWVKACAVHTAALIAPVDLDLLAEVAAGSTPPDGVEAAVLHETVAGYRERQLDPV